MIYTERLILRPFVLGDKAFLYELDNDKKVNRFRISDTVTMENCIENINVWNDTYGTGLLNVYLIAQRQSMKPIGLITLFKTELQSRVELGYRMLPEYWGQGFCSEATAKLIVKCFNETEAVEVFAETHPMNVNSIRFLESNNFFEEECNRIDRGKIFITAKAAWV